MTSYLQQQKEQNVKQPAPGIDGLSADLAPRGTLPALRSQIERVHFQRSNMRQKQCVWRPGSKAALCQVWLLICTGPVVTRFHHMEASNCSIAVKKRNVFDTATLQTSQRACAGIDSIICNPCV